MIKPEQIYDATNGGLDIIKSYYPEADEKKAFRIREEKTPSARLKKFGTIWKVTDFGDDGHAQSAIDICMKEDNLSFGQAIYRLAGIYNIADATIFESNRAEIRTRPAEAGETEKYFDYEAKAFTEFELKLLGPKVKAETCKEYNYESVSWYCMTKKNAKGELTTTIVKSTDTYPIYIRTCKYLDGTVSRSFYKIYQPLNYDKAYRFFYVGDKPKEYINGYDQLQAAAEQFEENQLAENENENSDESGSEKKVGRKKLKKFPEAVICSGERDALCCAALGYKPLWFNSEHYKLSEKEYFNIKKLVERVYNIPDLDETGIRKGTELAMQYLEIHTAWLPEWLKSYRDSRGRHRKDLRDFVELCPDTKSFKELLSVAMPMQFWETTVGKNGFQQEINTEYLLHFLTHNGFGTIESKNDKTERAFIHVKNNVVSEIKSKAIKAFLRKFAIDRNLNIQIRNLINNSTRVSESVFDLLPEKQLDFTDFSHNQQFLFFQNSTWEVTAAAVTPHKTTAGKYVWDEEIIKHEVKRLDSSFAITHIDEDIFDIEIKNRKSKFFSYLINGSRVHWREELENRINNYTGDKEKYLLDNRFEIAGELLSDEEKETQKRHLINKIFTIGYLLHRYKVASRPWCVYAMDNKVGDANDSNGRSGKSFCFKAIRHFMKSVTLQGRNPKLTDNQHIYDRVTQHTDYVLIDDANQYLDFNYFFDTVTGEWIVNPKNNRSYEIPFELSPKMTITTNFTPTNIDPSTQARLLYVVFGDYYHEKTEDNDYRESRSIRDDFKMDLQDGLYSPEDWNLDINFFVDCLQFYLGTLKNNVKINPPLDNVKERTLITIMGDNFHDWALTYFGKESENCNRLVSKKEALKNFLESTNTGKWTTQKFTKALKSYCKKYGYILNPLAFQNSERRIVRKVDNVSTDMVYVQTTQELNESELISQEYEGRDYVF